MTDPQLLADPKWNPVSLFAWVQDLIMDQTGVDRAAITPAATLWHDLNCDETDLLEMVLTMEAAFSIEIPDGAIETRFGVTEMTVQVQHVRDYLWDWTKHLRATRPPSQVAGKQRTAEALKVQKDDPTQ